MNEGKKNRKVEGRERDLKRKKTQGVKRNKEGTKEKERNKQTNKGKRKEELKISMLKLLQPTGHVMHHQFNIQQL